MDDYEYRGNINDYIIDEFLNDPINEYEEILKSLNANEVNYNNIYDIDYIENKLDIYKERISAPVIGKKSVSSTKSSLSERISAPVIGKKSVSSTKYSLSERRSTPVIGKHKRSINQSDFKEKETEIEKRRRITIENENNKKRLISQPNSEIAKRRRIGTRANMTNSRRTIANGGKNIKKGGNSKSIEYGNMHQKYMKNLYIYDNYHDFNGKSGPNNISIPSELLLKSSKGHLDTLKSSPVEKIFFNNALIDILKENKALFQKYHYININNSKMFSNNGAKVEDITTPVKFISIINNNFNFINNKIIYDGMVSKGTLKIYKNMIEKTLQTEITAEIIFDPMNTSIDDYKKMKKELKNAEILKKFSENTNKVFNTDLDNTEGLTNINDTDMLSAFNKKTREYFNIVYYQTIKKNEYSIALLLKNKNRNIYNNIYNNIDKISNKFLKILQKPLQSSYYVYEEVNINRFENKQNQYLAFDIAELHIGKGIDLINSVNNIKLMINMINENKIKNELKSIKDYMIYYLYENEKEKNTAIEILFDLKKAGDYGKVLLCFYNNINNTDEKYLLATNDTLCALNGILRKNINVVFGSTENNDKRLCFYSCCNDNYDIEHLKNILQLTFRIKINKDLNAVIKNEINNISNAEIINQLIEELNEELKNKYYHIKDNKENGEFRKIKIKFGNGNKDFFPLNEEERKSLFDEIDKIKILFFNNINLLNKDENLSLEKYKDKHKEYFNEYIYKIDDLITIYEEIIIRNNDIIKYLNNYIALLKRNPLNILKILISNPNRLQRDNRGDPFKKIDNCIKGSDNSNISKANCIANYYILNSRKIKDNIEKLTNLLDIFILNIINGQYNDDIKMLIYKLYYFNIKNIYKKLFDDINYNENKNNIKEYLPYLIKLFNEYLNKRKNNTTSEIRAILQIVLRYIEEFEKSFDNITKKLDNINTVLDKKIPNDLLNIINKKINEKEEIKPKSSKPSKFSSIKYEKLKSSKSSKLSITQSFIDYINKFFTTNQTVEKRIRIPTFYENKKLHKGQNRSI